MKKALVAPLNWGLGHATRCIPIIRSLLAHNIHVHIASDGKALKVLTEEFPKLPAHELSTLDITYGSYFMWSMLHQAPSLLKLISQDRKMVRSLFKSIPFDLIISDNRYGVHHPLAYNVFMTHQIQVLHPGWVIPISRSVTNFCTRHFDEIWVPDFESENNLTGAMSKPKLSRPKKYVGLLSRFDYLAKSDRNYQIAFILSGPEPARTIFENLILGQLKDQYSIPDTILVRGLPGQKDPLNIDIPNLAVVQYMNAEELNQVLIDSEYVVCRSGYTSVMDLLRLGKKALLVPTPGQVEQEYLAQRLSDMNLFFYVDQKDFEIQIIEKLATFNNHEIPKICEFNVVDFLPDVLPDNKNKLNPIDRVLP